MSETPCQCRPSQFPFHCARHNCTKSKKFHALCQTARYYQLWEQCQGPGQSTDCLPQHSRGLGDTIAKITRATGLDRVVKKLAQRVTKKDCGCNKRRDKLNTALPYKQPSQLKQASQSTATQTTALQSATAPRPVEIAPTLKQPQPPAIENWAVGITTAPRRNPTLKTCIESVKRAGWNPTIFAEPGSDLTGTEGCDIVQRPTRLGAWHNWLAMARQLLDENPDANVIVTIQDDTIIAPRCKEFLERDLWPCPNVGFVSLYTPKHYSILHVVEDNNGNEVSRHLSEFRARRQAKKLKHDMVTRPRPTGCWRVSTSSLWGACALIFPRAALSQIVNHRIAGNWKGVKSSKNSPQRAAHKIANVDTAIGKIVMALRLEMRTYTPSLAQHIARFSSIGHGDNRGRRAALITSATMPTCGRPLNQRPIAFASTTMAPLIKSATRDTTMLAWTGTTAGIQPACQSQLSVGTNSRHISNDAMRNHVAHSNSARASPLGCSKQWEPITQPLNKMQKWLCHWGILFAITKLKTAGTIGSRATNLTISFSLMARKEPAKERASCIIWNNLSIRKPSSLSTIPIAKANSSWPTKSHQNWDTQFNVANGTRCSLRPPNENLT